MNHTRSLRIFLVAGLLLLTACQSVGVHGEAEPGTASGLATGAPVLALGDTFGMAALTERIAEYPVVFVGETHDRYGDHLGQLDVIRGLAERGVPLVIGMEMFQQPYQSYLDDYIAGRIDERAMLVGTGWFDRWRYDYRLYRPILAYAREQGIPVVALNIESELVDRVSSVGIDGLEAEERARLPETFDGYDPAHRARLREIFEGHAASGKADFDRFLQVQEVWDQGMAKRASEALREHSGRHLVVLSGSGHLMYGAGIPSRVDGYTGARSVIILPGDGVRVRPGIADYLVYPEAAELPKRGVMGVFLGEAEKGVEVKRVIADSPAAAAGVEEGDVIMGIDGVDLHSPAELKALLVGRVPGDRISVRLVRSHLLGSDETLEIAFPLGE